MQRERAAQMSLTASLDAAASYFGTHAAMPGRAMRERKKCSPMSAAIDEAAQARLDAQSPRRRNYFSTISRLRAEAMMPPKRVMADDTACRLPAGRRQAELALGSRQSLAREA